MLGLRTHELRLIVCMTVFLFEVLLTEVLSLEVFLGEFLLSASLRITTSDFSTF